MAFFKLLEFTFYNNNLPRKTILTFLNLHPFLINIFEQVTYVYRDFMYCQFLYLNNLKCCSFDRWDT